MGHTGLPVLSVWRIESDPHCYEGEF